MRIFLMTAAMTMVLGTQAQAEELIHSVEIEKIDSVEYLMMDPMGWETDCTVLDKKNPFGTQGSINPADIVRVGKQIYKIVKENEPVLEARGMKASALPRGVECWNQMTGWSPTRADSYNVTYKNGFGMKVVELQFRILYTYGGQLNGQGAYLANSSIQYSNISVLWGYIFNADVEIPQAVNMGTEQAPLAGMQMTLNWSVKTRPISLKKTMSSSSFFISGDGRPTKVLD